MKLFKDLNVFDLDGEKCVYLDEFLQYLRNHHTENDQVKKVKKSNVLSELKRYRITSIFEKNGKTIITFLSVLRYIFHHVDNLNKCNEIASHIASTFQNRYVSHGSHLDLYKSIVKTKIKGTFFREFSQEIKRTNFEKKTLHECYKDEFDPQQWQIICLFEHHYAHFGNPTDLTYEETVQQKWAFLKAIERSDEIAKEWLLSSLQVMKIRQERFLAANIQNDVHLHCAMKHIPRLIDSFLINKLAFYYPDRLSSIIITDIFTSDVNNIVDINIEVETEIHADDMVLIANRATSLLAQSHALLVSRVNFFKSGALEIYTRPHGQVARFCLRDDINLRKLDSSLIFTITGDPDSDIIDVETLNSEGNCKSCFSIEAQRNPLCMRDFNIIEEWLLDVPLSIQAIFESFINKDTFWRNSDKKAFMQSKLTRLYALYDILLNTTNKMHFGLLQRNNTEELLMNYHSICATFNITSNFGTTSSLITAERKVKEKAIDDVCYFNTYIKKYPVTYSTDAGVVEKEVSIRDCHLILMLDNLVRLRYLSDPNPGDSPSMQMCTLPITIQGMPKDAAEVEAWHDNEICDGSLNCPCKKIIPLTRSDATNVLFELLPNEQDSKDRFSQLCMWGHSGILQLVEEYNLLENTEINHVPATNTVDGNEVHSLFEKKISNYSQTGESRSYIETTDDDLHQMLQEVTVEELVEDDIENLFFPLELDNDISHDIPSSLNMSMSNLSINENDEQKETYAEPVPNLFGFKKYTPPFLLTKHPPPAVGRDDDINKLREVLDDIMLKTGYSTQHQYSTDRILFGPDNKIGANLIKLVDSTAKYKTFLPEFPLLHLRKSKITILFSGYKNAGLIELLMYMTDNDKQEWSKLISAQHIDVATKYIRRLSVAFHTAFLVKFIESRGSLSQEELLKDLKNLPPQKLADKWGLQVNQFLKNGSQANSTFALHKDMMDHCDEVLAIYLAERLGGESGYDLLLAAVKSSLLFAYVNGATAYAPFCTKLLIQHYSAGPFHKSMKKALFSTPIGNSEVNFSGDTKREMDHQDVLRSFRSGSNLSSVLDRMSLIDPLNEARKSSDQNLSRKKLEKDMLGWSISSTDVNHIIRVVKLILRTGSISSEPCLIPYNMYTKDVTMLSSSMLDANTCPVAKYLLERFLAREGLCDFHESDVTNIEEAHAPRDLINRVKKSKGVTIRRSTQKLPQIALTERDQKEQKRKKILKKEVKQNDRLSSEMNTCQALVKPDCSKPKVLKSKGIQKAMINLLKEHGHDDDVMKLLSIDQSCVPSFVTKQIKGATIEFAGVKFKTYVGSGEQYLKYVENVIIKSWKYLLPDLQRLVICEEKYKFTPDDFKAATRQQRAQKSKTSISHLKHGDDILSSKIFNKEAIVTSSEGKSLVSTYLAANAEKLQLNLDLEVDIDSEFILNGCLCMSDTCTNSCNIYTTPVRCVFANSEGKPKIFALHHIKQCKGEAEMAQVDWLFDIYPGLKPGDAIVSIVSSGDIDAVVIHLFTLSAKWPRDENGKFLYPVYVILQKPQKKLDFYDITGILQLLESSVLDSNIGQKIAVSLCIGGNDFVPKMYGQAHDKILKSILHSPHLLCNLFKFNDTFLVSIDTDVFVDLVKQLYCPKRKNPNDLTFDEVQQSTMQVKRKSSDSGLTARSLRSAQLWLPPKSALIRLGDIINLQILYLMTVGDPTAPLPNFLASPALKKCLTGEVEYNFGDEMQIDISELVPVSNPKRKSDVANTPQKRERKKKPMTSTPRKSTNY